MHDCFNNSKQHTIIFAARIMRIMSHVQTHLDSLLNCYVGRGERKKERKGERISARKETTVALCDEVTPHSMSSNYRYIATRSYNPPIPYYVYIATYLCTPLYTPLEH